MEVIATAKNEVKGEMDESYLEVTGDLKKSKKPQVFRTGTNSPISVSGKLIECTTDIGKLLDLTRR